MGYTRMNEYYLRGVRYTDFPALTLAQVYGSIAYYLEHRAALDARFAALCSFQK